MTTINRINMRSLETDKRTLRQRTGVKEYENHIGCVKSSQVWKILCIKKFFNQGFYKKRWRVFFSHLRQNIIDDVLSFQGHSCWLPSSHTAWPHQTLSEVHLEIDFGRKGWKAASSLVLSYKWIFCQQLFFLH